jgi:hypothetical protein
MDRFCPETRALALKCEQEEALVSSIWGAFDEFVQAGKCPEK